MLRTKFFAQTRPTQPAQPAAPAGLQATDPADFKFIAGGAPRGGWTSSSGTTTFDRTDTTELALAAPRGGW